MGEKDVEGVYVRLLPGELANLIIDEAGAYPEFKLKNGAVILRLHRVRVAGRVEAIEDRGRLVEITVSDDKGVARVRAWNRDATNLLSLKPGDLIEVLGTLRSYGGKVYIALKLFRKINEKYLINYINMLKRDRLVLTSMEDRADSEAKEV